MQFILEIERRRSAADKPYTLTAAYEGDGSATVALALTELNADSSRRDINGAPFEPIRWECSCLQKKCGACAMVISGRPMLACDAKLEAVAKRGKITVAPLKKFPPVADLIVDREPVFKALAEARLWLENSGSVPAENTDIAFETSRCLQCGCCLEVCPNYTQGKSFFGAAFANDCYLVATRSGSFDTSIQKEYAEHFAKGCSKSLSCVDVCPMHIPTLASIAKMNRKA